MPNNNLPFNRANMELKYGQTGHLKLDQDEKDVKIFLGRVHDPDKHKPTDHWATWERDVKLAEKILIFKYSPN